MFLAEKNPNAAVIAERSSNVHNSGPADPELPAVSAHFVYEGSNCFNACVRRDAMAKVEYVSGCRTERVEHPAGLFAHAPRRCEKHGRIKIALQRHRAADASPRLGGIHAPVEPDRVATACRDCFEPGARAFGEDDAGNLAHLRYHRAHVGE